MRGGRAPGAPRAPSAALLGGEAQKGSGLSGPSSARESAVRPLGAEVAVTRRGPRVRLGVASLPRSPRGSGREAHAPCEAEAGKDGVSDSDLLQSPRKGSGGGRQVG